MKTKIFCILISLLLGGCSTAAIKPNPDVDNSTDASLAEAAASVSQSLVSLAQTSQSAHPLNVHPAPNPASYGMSAISSVDWSGPIQPLVEKIAEAVNYRVKVIGQKPAIPILVTISAKNTMIGNILLDAGFQCGKRASVIVYPSNKTIEIRYAGN